MEKTKLTKEQLAILLASYLKANKIAVVGFEASKDNVLGLLDKIGKTIEIDGIYTSELDWMDGDTLPAGKTIEEYFEDFIAPEDYVKESGLGNVNGPEIGARPVRYSYTQGRKKWKVKKHFDDLERAFSTEAGAINALEGITERLESSYRMWRDDAKRKLLGTLASKAKQIMTTTTTFAKSTAYTTGTAVRKDTNGSAYAIVFKDIPSSSPLDWAGAVGAGYLAPVNLVEKVDVPTDDATGEAFIIAVKEAVRKMKFKNHENLNGALVKPTPEANRRLVIDTSLMPELEVKTLAGAFHADRLAMPATMSEVEDFGTGNSDVLAILLDERGAKLHNSYNATRTQELADDDAILYVKHTEDTAFISANTFVHVFLKK